jgi:exonuclease III
MKVVTWNCNGAFRKKYRLLDVFEADLFVIQECEDPRQTKDAAYKQFASNCLWEGPTKNKGIGVFAKTGISLCRAPLETAPLELFLPCIVDGRIPLLATWTRHANSPNFGYIGQLWKFLQKQSDFLGPSDAMLIGDLNSNTRWDEWDRWWNHSDVVKQLSDLGLRSAYHEFFNESQGNESKPTLFLQRNRKKAYHIDYGFFGRHWTPKHVSVGDADRWLEHSDHMPILFELSPLKLYTQ